jgi:hypothetical protein
MDRPLPQLEWLDSHPWIYPLGVGGLIVLSLARTVAPLLAGQSNDARGHDWGWGLVILAIMAAGRWPALLFTRGLNVDEGQLLAGAHTLLHDPVFWRSVNGGTAGPLDFFALWPAGWLFGWDTFLTGRVTALALLAIALTLAHQAMAVILGRPAARLATLAAVSVEALTHAIDFLHYSTELVPVALLAGAAYAAARRWVLNGGPQWSGLGGLLLGAVPFAKLQPAPIALGFGLCWAAAEFRTNGAEAARHRGYLLAGALLPAAFFASQLTVAGEWRSFVVSYLVFNFSYAAAGVASTTLAHAAWQMLNNSLLWDSLLALTLMAGLVWLALLVRPRPHPDRTIRIFTWAVVAACGGTLAIILSPRRAYLHYWQLLLVPATLLLGVLIARLLTTSRPAGQRQEQRLVALTALAFFTLLLQHRVRHPNLFVGELAHFWQFNRTELAARVAARARPGDALAIWGRADNLYVETGLRQATRDPSIGGAVMPGPYQEYFRERYLADLIRTKPAVFLDATCPAGFQFQSSEYAHDRVYPELAALIRADYVLVEEFAQARIYQRRDLVGR